jgi:hypothetical protein
VLQGRPVTAPTVVFVPFDIHYAEGFQVYATSPRVAWHPRDHILLWWPDPRESVHQLVLARTGPVDSTILPQAVRELVNTTRPVLQWPGPLSVNPRSGSEPVSRLDGPRRLL